MRGGRVFHVCLALVTLLVYRDRLHKILTTTLIETTTTEEKPQVDIFQLLSKDHEKTELLLKYDLKPCDKINCGKEKCFYESKSNAGAGYLVARSGTSGGNTTGKFDRLVEGWEYATRLEKQYHIKQFLISPPERILLSEELAELLNKNLWFGTRDMPVLETQPNHKKRKPRFDANTLAYVQKVKKAPTPNLLLACAHSNREHFERHVETFLLGVSPKFKEKFGRNLRKTFELLQQEPDLYKDFQVIMDTRGVIYHLDFDRVFQTREVDETAECLAYLREAETHIYNSLQDTFRPENIVASERNICGKEKCFFRVQSNESVGYLVARSEDKENRRFKFDTLHAGWQLAEELRKDYNTQHFLLAPPANITITPDLASHLSQNLFSEKRQKLFKDQKAMSLYPEGSLAYIQKVKVAPEPNLLLGCAESKMNILDQLLDAFLPSVEDNESFGRQFSESFAQVRTLLEIVPCLVKDFQILVDTEGRIYHLDFDRCYSPEDGAKKYTDPDDLAEAPCAQALNEMEQRVQKAVARSSPAKKKVS